MLLRKVLLRYHWRARKDEVDGHVSAEWYGVGINHSSKRTTTSPAFRLVEAGFQQHDKEQGNKVER
jgi:hypothetical protein